MHLPPANGDSSRLSQWLRVRRFAVPPPMIETATARRAAGDWAGACAAAAVDVDLDLRSAARTYGRELAALVRSDLRHLAPDLLRWHMPRVAPDGRLRPELTISLARYGSSEPAGPRDGPPSSRAGTSPVHLVVRTPPAWADGGQRISLALWDASRPEVGAGLHPHPHPSRRFRLDLHRHLWDARRSGELRSRAGARGGTGGWDIGLLPAGPIANVPDGPGGVTDVPGVPDGTVGTAVPGSPGMTGGHGAAMAPTVSAGPVFPPVPEAAARLLRERGCAVGRWAAEAARVLGAEGRPGADGRPAGPVAVRYGMRQWLLLHLAPGEDHLGTNARIVAASTAHGFSQAPILPDAATWILPDLELLRAGLLAPDDLHPLVASALVPDGPPPGTPAHRDRVQGPSAQPRFVDCRGARHRIGLVDGVLAPLDHDPDEIRRELLLVALNGPPLPCLQEIDAAHRRPECLPDVQARLDHGDTAGALAAVEALLGPEALLRHGALREELEAAARRRIDHGLYRAALADPLPSRNVPKPRRPRGDRSHPRHTTRR